MDNQLTLNLTHQDELDLSWMGGLLDGEGSFNLHWKKDKTRRKQKAHVQVKMGNTNKEIVAEYLRLLDKFNIKYYQYLQQKSRHHKVATIVVVNRLKSVYAFCVIIRDFLRGKKGQCSLVLRFVASRLVRTNGKYNIEYSAEEIGLLELLREKNRKGVRDRTSSTE